MSVTPESQPADRFDFYAAQYSRFESEAAAEIRREVYGEDIGQQGWRSLDEQALIADLIRESSPCDGAGYRLRLRRSVARARTANKMSAYGRGRRSVRRRTCSAADPGARPLGHGHIRDCRLQRAASLSGCGVRCRRLHRRGPASQGQVRGACRLVTPASATRQSDIHRRRGRDGPHFHRGTLRSRLAGRLRSRASGSE